MPSPFVELTQKMSRSSSMHARATCCRRPSRFDGRTLSAFVATMMCGIASARTHSSIC
jgi:hypothetical protein